MARPAHSDGVAGIFVLSNVEVINHRLLVSSLICGDYLSSITPSTGPSGGRVPELMLVHFKGATQRRILCLCDCDSTCA